MTNDINDEIESAAMPREIFVGKDRYNRLDARWGVCDDGSYKCDTKYHHDDVVREKEKRIAELEGVVQMVNQWSNGLRHKTSHESKMCKLAKQALKQRGG